MFGGFGASSTPGFGTSAPAFGSSTPGFGAASSASAGFGFSNPFGGATPTPSPFGQSQPQQQQPSSGFGGAFGTPQSSAAAFGFGAPQSSAGGFGFGTPQPSQGFGGPQSSAAAFGFGTPQSSASAFGFGSTPSAPSLFGQQSSGGGVFGGATFGAPQQQQAGSQGFGLGGGLFGGVAASQPQSYGGFGQPQQQQQQQQGQLVPQSGVHPSDFTAAAEVEAIAAAFGQSGDLARSRFRHLFLNVLTNPAARLRPPHVDALQWRQAMFRAGGEHNKQGLWPVPAEGFRDLLARKAAQDTAIQEHEDRMRQAQRAVAELVQKQDVLVHASLDKMRKEHQALSARLLSLMRTIDLLEARSAGALGLWDDTSASATAAVARALESLEGTLAPSAPNGLQRRVDSLAAAAHLQAHAGREAGEEDQISADELSSVYGILKSHAEALTQMQRALARTDRDLAVMAGPKKQQLY